MKRNEIKSYAEYEKSIGVDNSTPEGEYITTVVKAVVEREDDGRPKMNVQLKVKDGPRAGMFLFPRLEWFIDPEGEMSDELQKTVTGIIRGSTNRFLEAIFERKLEAAPETVEVVGADDDYDEVARVMETWVGPIDGQTVLVKVTYKKDEAGERVNDFPRFSFKRVKAEAVFSR